MAGNAGRVFGTSEFMSRMSFNIINKELHPSNTCTCKIKLNAGFIRKSSHLLPLPSSPQSTLQR